MVGAIYKSHSTQWSVWIKINSKNGSVEVKECLDQKGGYELVRRESFTEFEHETFEVGRYVGYFKLRKDAENFALVAAMHINGDIDNPELRDPRKFGGVPYRSSPDVDRLREAFWAGVQDKDPKAGWKDIDPAGILVRMPSHYHPFGDCWTLEESKSEEIPLSSDFADPNRADSISFAASSIISFYKQNLFRESLKVSLDKNVGKLVQNDDFSDENFLEDDLPYAVLLALSWFRNRIPVALLFPNHMIQTRQTIRKCWDEMPLSARDYIRARSGL